MRRHIELAQGCYYHIFTKSIAGFKIFMSKGEYLRILDTVRYYQNAQIQMPLSRFIQLKEGRGSVLCKETMMPQSYEKKLVEIIAYCFMPTHIHFILKQSAQDGISNFMRLILNSYTRYFNIKHKRNGPLWQGRFKNVLVESDEQLYHLTRYIHLNPVTANMVNRPDQWEHSSYCEYVNLQDSIENICNFKEVIDVQPEKYAEFVNERINYQRELGRIKNLLLE